MQRDIIIALHLRFELGTPNEKPLGLPLVEKKQREICIALHSQFQLQTPIHVCNSQ